MSSRQPHRDARITSIDFTGDFDLQQLERRTLMASDPLAVAFSRGVLTVTGSRFDDVIAISRSGANWSVVNGGWSKLITAAVTKLVVNAKAGNDSVTVDASSNVPATLLGDLGNDTLVGAGGATSLNGNAGDDSLTGGANNDLLYGDLGNDTLVGGGGANKLFGGAGNDVLSADAGNDSLQGDAGNDTLTAGDGANTLNGGAGNDALTSGTGNDILIGDVGNDLLDAGAGDDRLTGGTGNDALDAGNGDDFVQGGLGTDTLAGGTGRDTIDYTDHTAAQGVWLSLAGTTDGGMNGESDDVDDSFEVANGGAGADHMSGNDNGNVFYGNAGNDTINAGEGNDVIYGGAGNDALSGHGGMDSIYGGAGDDLLQGGDGDDLLVSVGGGKKTILVGDDGLDTFWLDGDVTENTVDLSAAETAAGSVHRVAAFANKMSKELTGAALADPALKAGSARYRNFKTRPLFSSNGPAINDVAQGQLGDCYFLAQLGAYAVVSPQMIRQSIVDFGDGTYGVQFTKGGNKLFYRIDADLPSYNASTLAYAAFGAEGSLWVALYEKAWTYARTAKNTYGSIEAGFMTEVSNAFGKSSNWGATSTVANSLLATLKAEMDAGKTVTVGTGREPAGSLLIGGHAYTVISIVDDGAGGYTVVLRNPWGIDGYTCADNLQDGYVTLTTAQFGAWTDSYAVCAA